MLAGNGREALALSLVFPVALWFQTRTWIRISYYGRGAQIVGPTYLFFPAKRIRQTGGGRPDSTRSAGGQCGMVELFLWSCLATLSYVPTNTKLPNKYGNSFCSSSSQWAELVAGVLRYSMGRTLNMIQKRKVTAILSKHLDTLTNIDNLATLCKEVEARGGLIKLIPYLILYISLFYYLYGATELTTASQNLTCSLKFNHKLFILICTFPYFINFIRLKNL